MQTARIAVVGAGLIGARHVACIAAGEGAVLAGLADPGSAAKGLAERHGVPWWADAEAMLAAGHIDGVVIAAPTDLHERIGMACIRAGVPALIEKPIAHDLAAADRLNDAAEAAKVTLLIGHHRRYEPAVTEARRLIAAGRLGRLVGVTCHWCVAKPAAYFAPAWRRGPGGGPVLINLIHEIDLLRTLLGDIREVSAFGSHAVRGHDTEDTAAIALRFQNGALGTILLSDAAPSPWTWEQGTGESPNFPKSGESAMRIFGTEAALELPGLRLWRHGGTPDWMTPIAAEDRSIARGDIFALQIAHFVDVIRGAAPGVSGREGQRSLAATLAVLEAARTGTAVRLG